MNILLTGCAGFIGYHTALLLLKEGHGVFGIDNLNDSTDVNLKNWRLNELKSYSNFEFLKIDICDKGSLSKIFYERKFNAIINLAARAGVRTSLDIPQVYIDTNVSGVLNLLEACKTYHIKKFILASTSSLYGSRNQVPYKEDDNTDFPLSPYAATKKAAEVLCASYHHLHKIDVTIFRYFTVYGPAGRPDMTPLRFVQLISEDKPITVFGDGLQQRDFTYVEDIARGTIGGLSLKGMQTINLGGDKPVTLNQFIELIEKNIGKKAQIDFKPFHAADMMATWADISKARQDLNWEPKTNLEEGIKKTIEWYNSNREWARNISL